MPVATPNPVLASSKTRNLYRSPLIPDRKTWNLKDTHPLRWNPLPLLWDVFWKFHWSSNNTGDELNRSKLTNGLGCLSWEAERLSASYCKSHVVRAHTFEVDIIFLANRKTDYLSLKNEQEKKKARELAYFKHENSVPSPFFLPPTTRKERWERVHR